MTGTGEAVMFWITAPLMVMGALGLVFAKRAVYAALSMVFVMILMGALFLAQRADFLGLVQVFVYTGAVMMMFIFVVMVVGVDASDTFVDTLRGHRWVAAVAAIGLGMLLIAPLAAITVPAAESGAAPGTVTGIAVSLFSTYLVAFEMIGVLLSIAGVAALTLAHRERLAHKPSQRDLANARVRDNVFVAGLPAPGVYARHNAADTPALLPDGTPSELSVSRVLRARAQTGNPTEFVEAVEHSENAIEEGEQR